MKTKIPVDFIFNPNWWYRNYEIPFAEDFYLNKQVRGEAPFLGGCADNRSCRDLHSLDNGDMFNRDEPFDSSRRFPALSAQ